MSMDTASGDVRWTERKRQVLELIARGRTNAEIADALGVSLAGAKWHVSEVLSVLGVGSREEAAEYWRRERSASRRVSRGARALFGLLLSSKTAMGAAGMAAVAGGAIVVAGLSTDYQGSPAQPAASPTPATGAIRGAELDYVDIMTVHLPDGDIVTWSASLGPELCFRETRTSWPNGFGYGCYRSRSDFEPSLLLGLGGGRATLYRGATPLNADRVVIELYDAPPVEPALVRAPVSLDLPMFFWAAVIPNGEMVARVTSYDANGAVLESESVYDPPGTPPRPQITAPLRELIQVGSGRADPQSGSIPFGGSRPGAIADPAGGKYRFRIEHDGKVRLQLVFWCQTGIIPLEWVGGPDAAGNGVVSAQVPPDSAGCFFRESGADGTYRITAIAGP